MGLLGSIAALLALKSDDKATKMKSILPQGVDDCLNMGILPTIIVDSLMLDNGETVHYADKACLMTNKNQHGYVRSYGNGFGVSVPFDTGTVKYTPGNLYITNKRIIFTAQEKGYEKSLSKLTSFIPHTDGIEIQFGNKTYCMILPTASSAIKTFKLLKQSKTF